MSSLLSPKELIVVYLMEQDGYPGKVSMFIVSSKIVLTIGGQWRLAPKMPASAPPSIFADVE